MEQETDFSNLYTSHYHSVYKYISSITWSSSLTEDVVQETFLEAWKQFASLREHPNMTGWLMRTACYKLRNMIRKLHYFEMISLTENLPLPGDKEYAYEIKELKLLLESVCTREEQLLFRRYYLSGYTPKEIAVLEGITENNVRVRLSRLVKKLRGQDCL